MRPLLKDDVKIIEVVSEPDTHGVYEAYVEMRTPNGEWMKKKSNNGINTMYPKDWDAARIQAEVDSAWARQTPHPAKENMWRGESTSGVVIEGYKDPKPQPTPCITGVKR